MYNNDEIIQIAEGLLKLTKAHIQNKLRFSCVFCGFRQGEYDKGEKGYLYIGVCMACAPHTVQYLEKASHDHPQTIVDLAKQFKELL